MSRRLDRGRNLLRRRLTHRGVVLAVIGLAALTAAAAIGLGPGRSPKSSSVRQVMAPFQPVSDGGSGYGPILAAAARLEGSRPDFDRIGPAARAAASAARRLEGQDHGPLADLWDQLAGEMKRSADDLERACQRIRHAGAAGRSPPPRRQLPQLPCRLPTGSDPAHPPGWTPRRSGRILPITRSDPRRSPATRERWPPSVGHRPARKPPRTAT